MIKLDKDGFVYYFENDDIFKIALEDFRVYNSNLGFLKMSILVIDKKKNEVVKCRYDFEEFFDKFLGV